MPIDVLDDLLDLPDRPPEMNPDLADWAAAHDVATAPAVVASPETGACAACGRAAGHRCVRCAARACARHHHVMTGLCIRCRSEDDPPDPDAATEPVDDLADARPRIHADLDLDWIE